MSSPEVSVILPTYNEADSIEPTLAELFDTVGHLDLEVVVVDDDSPDHTWKVVEDLAVEDARVRILRRQDERGLATAVLHGMAHAAGQIFVVMDADGQHDPAVLEQMVIAIRIGHDVCVASREVEGASYGPFPASRRWLSKGGLIATNLILRTGVKDPLSGFFAVSRAHAEAVAPHASPRGFKILLDFLCRGRPDVAEIPFTFRLRERGASKLGASTLRQFAGTLWDLRRTRD